MTIPTFPVLPGLTYPVKSTPLWSTLHQVTVSGKDTPLSLYSYPRRKYELQYDMLRSDSVNAEWQTLVGFYNQMRGSAAVFQFNDPDDESVTAEPFGTGDGTTTTFQLVRALGGFAEPVLAPTGTPSIFVNGTLSGSATVGTGGVVTFGSAPASGADLTWTGSYNWLCRFDDDSVEFEKFMHRFWSLGKINFTTVKL